jgi:hypothetical protein
VGDGRGQWRCREYFPGDGAEVHRGIRGGAEDEDVDYRVGVAPPPAHGHGDVVSVERQRDSSSSSLHAIAAREAARLGRPRPRSRGRGTQEASRLGRPRPQQAGGGEQGPDLGPTGLDLDPGVFFSENRFFMSADVTCRHQIIIFCIDL